MYDVAIVGGGIVGLSTGMALAKQYPQLKIVMIEKEETIACHQTGRNSGVIHSGIYYKPGSLKARFAREGNRELVDFCKTYGITYEMCGKVIVAVDKQELELMDNLYKRGLENGLRVKKIGREELLELEPHVNGIGAIHVLDCGIVDYKKVSLTYQRLIEEFDNEFRFSTKVEKVYENSDEVTLETNRGTIKARYLINCAGLYSDKLAKMAGLETGMKIVPFRGEYYELVKEKEHLVKNLIYPVPNPNFPFLGVHLTRMITGGIHAGPNAVLAFRREGYKKTDVHMKELFEVLGYPGFWKMALPNVKEGMHELIRSLFKKAFLKSLQRLVPEIQMNDIVPSSSGVRAQALTRDGRLVDDFAIFEGKRSIHVCNAPSPAATASLKIGQEIVRRFRASFLQ
jgi:L-2-hydroxyglutarate oxidase